MTDKNKEEIESTLKNIEYMCNCCAEERKQKWQMENKDLKLQIGDYVKIAIEDKEETETEHLWFEVIGFKDKNLIIGRCDNNPIAVYNIKYNQVHTFKFEDIEAYMPKE